MSHYRIKTKFNTEGSYGSIDEKTLYCHHNLSYDYVTFYDEDGNCIMTIPDTMTNNLLDAINKLYTPFVKDTNKYSDGIENMTQDDIKKCNRL